jgi:hypothetical protein
VRLQNVVLRHDIFVLQKEFLIHPAGHIGPLRRTHLLSIV